MKHSCYVKYWGYRGFVFGIVEILLKMDFHNNFLKYKMSQFMGRTGS